jgi:hypothetical protein
MSDNRDPAGEDSGDNALILASYCTKFEDFFTPAARDLVARYLPGFMDQLVITPTELLHSAKYQKKLAEAGRPLMNAVDKVGTLQAKANKEGSSVKRVKDLHTLVSDGMKKVWDDERASPIPTFKPGAFMAAAAVFGVGGDQEYQINRMLTEHLFALKTWRDKMEALLALLQETYGAEQQKYIAQIIAECLRSENAMNALLGPVDRLEDRMNDLIDLWKGQWQPRGDENPMVTALSQAIGGGLVPGARPAIEVAMLRNLASKEPVDNGESDGELQALARVVRRARFENTIIGGAKLIALIEKRMARFINNEALTDIMREPRPWAEKSMALVNLITLAVGPGVRQTLLNFIDHYFSNEDFTKRLLAGNESPFFRLQGMANLHRAIRAAPLPEQSKWKYMEAIEAAHAGYMASTKPFELVDRQAKNSAQKTIMLIDLCRKGTFIDGRTMETARQAIQATLAQPDFKANYLAGATGAEAEKKIDILTKTLAALGISYG